MNKLKFGLAILKHQKQLAFVGYHFDRIEATDEDFQQIVSHVAQDGKDLALVRSDFRCENPNCKSKGKYLQFHHLIMRKAKDLIPANIYLSQRHYWGNIVILCSNCHDEYHSFIKGKKDSEELTITAGRIKKVRERFK